MADRTQAGIAYFRLIQSVCTAIVSLSGPQMSPPPDRPLLIPVILLACLLVAAFLGWVILDKCVEPVTPAVKQVESTKKLVLQSEEG